MPAKTRAKARGSARRSAGIGDDAVLKRTGKTWAQWVKALDGAGCRSMPHRDIAVIVHKKFGVGDWWSQMVTVGYERAAGLREKHQTSEGYRGSASKTVNVPVGALYEAWESPRARRKWLGEGAPFTVRKSTPNKSMRITWVDGTSNVDVNFTSKGPAKSHVAVEHGKLPDARSVARVKRRWGENLERLKHLLES